LYKDDNAVDVLTGKGVAATFTGTFAGAGDYTAQVDADAEHCQAVMNGSHAVIEHVLPSITIDGDAIQTVDQNSPITTITFTAANGATAISRSGNLPDGVTGETHDLVHTISGMPSAAGAFSYTIIATGDGGCTYSSSGVLSVNSIFAYPAGSGGPNTAYSTTTWSLTDRTVSDRITNADVSSRCALVTDLGDARTAQYTVREVGGVTRYYYNYYCVDAARSELCPSPWSAPTLNLYAAITAAVGGSDLAKAWVLNTWGYTGYVAGGELVHTDQWWMGTAYSGSEVTWGALVVWSGASGGSGLRPWYAAELRCMQ
jgi:hypothetical protein